MILLCPKVEESAPKIVADRLSALRESVSLTRHESRQNLRVGASLRSWRLCTKNPVSTLTHRSIRPF